MATQTQGFRTNSNLGANYQLAQPKALQFIDPQSLVQTGPDVKGFLSGINSGLGATNAVLEVRERAADAAINPSLRRAKKALAELQLNKALNADKTKESVLAEAQAARERGEEVRVETDEEGNVKVVNTGKPKGNDLQNQLTLAQIDLYKKRGEALGNKPLSGLGDNLESDSSGAFQLDENGEIEIPSYRIKGRNKEMMLDPNSGKWKMIDIESSENSSKIPGSSKALTEQQAGSLMYGKRMGFNRNILDGLESNYTPLKSKLPNILQDDLTQKFKASQENWIAALLRKESMSAIAKTEYNDARNQYFPSIGDSIAVRDQKKSLRKFAEQLMLESSGQPIKFDDVNKLYQTTKESRNNNVDDAPTMDQDTVSKNILNGSIKLGDIVKSKDGRTVRVSQSMIDSINNFKNDSESTYPEEEYAGSF